MAQPSPALRLPDRERPLIGMRVRLHHGSKLKTQLFVCSAIGAVSATSVAVIRGAGNPGQGRQCTARVAEINLAITDLGT